jgi:hypothetical protein
MFAWSRFLRRAGPGLPSAMLLARSVLLAVATCSIGSGCGPQTDRVARAADRAQPHLESFERFERWARRAASAQSALRGPHALSELVFAPIRHTPAVVAAWVRFEGDRPLVLALPASAQLPAAEQWVALRDPEIGSLRVATAERCPAGQGTPEPSDGAPSCVLISRAERGADLRAVTVTMAFASAAP